MAPQVFPPTTPPPYPARLYLARQVMTQPPIYSLRVSVWDGQKQCMTSRQIFELGTDPEQYIVYIEEQGYYINEELMRRIEPHFADCEARLEELLYLFVNPVVRRNLERFKSRKDMRSRPLTAAEQAAMRTEIHDFDRRRLHYLLYGSIDQSRLHQLPAKVARGLLGMSRDQREQYFVEQERSALHEDQVRPYLFAIFHIARFFDQSYARQAPQMLDEAVVDRHFIDQLCSLAADRAFWQGLALEPSLSEYLRRYLCMWVDYDYLGNPLMADYIRRFMNDHRRFSFPASAEKVTKEEYEELFGTTLVTLKDMTSRQLTRIYRQRAMRLHPDTGGDHEIFVRLTEAYNLLLAGKKRR